jgi:hypothetical protein
MQNRTAPEPALYNEVERKPRMARPKDQVRKLLDELGDNVSLEEIQYHIYVRQKVEKGREEVDKGMTISHTEVEERMSRWLGQ